MINIQLKYGSKKYQVNVNPETKLNDFMTQIEETTQVPKSGQKLIINGKTLTTLDHDKTLSVLGIANNCKIMVLGKRYDPQTDELHSKICDVESKSFDLDKKFAEITKEIKDIEDGFLESNLINDAIKSLTKRSKGCLEEYMKLLEFLDGLSFEEHQTNARSKRKSVVNSINASLDRNEVLIQRIESLKKE